MHQCVTPCTCQLRPKWLTMPCDCGRITVRCQTCGGFAMPLSPKLATSRQVTRQHTRGTQISTTLTNSSSLSLSLQGIMALHPTIVEVAECLSYRVGPPKNYTDYRPQTPPQLVQCDSNFDEKSTPQSYRYSDHFYFTPLTGTYWTSRFTCWSQNGFT